MTTANEGEVIHGITWQPDPDSPGILVGHYQGKELRIVPVGESEYDGHVDGERACTGSDDVTDTIEILKNHLDGIPRLPSGVIVNLM